VFILFQNNNIITVLKGNILWQLDISNKLNGFNQNKIKSFPEVLEFFQTCSGYF